MNWLNVKRAVAFVASFAVSGVLFAQAQSGNIYGTVSDDNGAPLPGVTLTVSGGGAPIVQVSDVQGQFRFLGLSPGTYRLEGALQGFSPVVYDRVVVNVNRNTSLSLTMNAAIEETITITAESPLLDPRKISTGATVDKTELEKIPSARDPWVILQTTPGVLVDRVNVGGNESGQQSQYTGGGDTGNNTSWSVDGVEITDVGAIGSSPSYYDFSAFEEMQVTTGGSDTTQRVGGVGMNMVTKRGTNEWRGSGRYLVDKDSWQSSFSPSSSDFGNAGPWNAGNEQPSFSQGNQIVEVLDYGAELGGPILQDKLWAWGSYGKQEVDLLTVNNFSDFTDLETWNAKFNWQVTQNNSAMLFFSSNDKVKIGRNASPNRPQPTTWNQGGEAEDPSLFGFFSERPTIAKIEDTHIFGSNFFLTGMYAESDGGFGLHPQGGLDATMGLSYNTLAWSGTFLDYVSTRPQDQYKLDGSYFFTTGNLNHELKFGAGYRQAEVRSTTIWPRNREGTYNGGSLYTYAYAEGILNYEVEYKNAYVQDTLTTGNLTVNVGVRYDDQGGTLLPGFANAPRNPMFTAFLPGYAQAGGDPGFDNWTDFSPRLGLTYAIGEEKKTLLRASYARFVDQLSGFSTFSQVYPIYPAPYVYFYSYDYGAFGGNNNGTTEPGELGPIAGFSPNYNPNNPSQLIRSRAVDPNVSAPFSDQVILGVEHSLLPEFVIGLTATYRENSDLLQNTELVFDGDPYSAANINSIGRRATRADFVVGNTYLVTLPDGKTTTVQTYSLRPGVQSRGGTILENGDYGQTYTAVSLTANKRLSNNWMMRGNFTWNDWEWDVPSSAIINPQQGSVGNQDGDRVISCVGTGSGAKGNVCISSAWSYSVNGMYQVAPDRAWGFNVAAALYGHEGYAQPYFLFRAKRSGFTNSTNTNVSAVNNPDDYKLDDVHTLDLRVEKEFKWDRIGLTLGVDVFNTLNENTVLQRQRRISGDRPETATNPDVRSTQADWVYEVLSPRIFRLGATFRFN